MHEMTRSIHAILGVASLSMTLTACDSETAFEDLIVGPAMEHVTVEGRTLNELRDRLRRDDWRQLVGRLTYPDELREMRQRRAVRLGLFVGENGRVDRGRVQESSGSAPIDEAAVTFARQFTFTWQDDPAGGVWVDSVVVAWPLFVVDSVPRPELSSVRELEDAVDIGHIDVVKGDHPPYGDWSPIGVIYVTTREAAAASGG